MTNSAGSNRRSSAAATLVLVHGAFHSAACWTALTAELEDRGVAAVTPDLPGHGLDPSPPGGLREDAARVAEMVGATAGPVVLVGHSYGGAVIGQAVADCERVVACVFLAGFALAAGESIVAATRGSEAEPSQPLELISLGGDVAVVEPRSARAIFYNDCTPADAEAAVTRLNPQRLSALVEAPTSDRWRQLPCGYIVCAEDRAFGPLAQRHLARRTDLCWDLPGGHSPFVSRPGKLADLLIRAVGELTGRPG